MEVTLITVPCAAFSSANRPRASSAVENRLTLNTRSQVA